MNLVNAVSFVGTSPLASLCWIDSKERLRISKISGDEFAKDISGADEEDLTKALDEAYKFFCARMEATAEHLEALVSDMPEIEIVNYCEPDLFEGGIEFSAQRLGSENAVNEEYTKNHTFTATIDPFLVFNTEYIRDLIRIEETTPQIENNVYHISSEEDLENLLETLGIGDLMTDNTKKDKSPHPTSEDSNAIKFVRGVENIAKNFRKRSD